MVQLSFLWLAAAALLHAAGSSAGSKVPPGEGEDQQRVRYTASWAVEITDGGDKAADIIARRHGCRNLGKVRVLKKEHYLRLRALATMNIAAAIVMFLLFAARIYLHQDLITLTNAEL